MKIRILIALIASLQIAGPALALDQSDWITPDNSGDTSQVDIVGTPTTTVNTGAAPSRMPMQSGWITQNDEVQPAQAAQAAAPQLQAQCSQSGATGQSQWQSGQCSQSGAAGQSQWITSNGQTDQSQLQGKASKRCNNSGSGSGTAAAVGSAIGHAAGGLAAAAVAIPMMMAASRMMTPNYGYGGMGGFRTYGPGGYRYSNPGYNMGSMMGSMMMQNAAFNLLRAL